MPGIIYAAIGGKNVGKAELRRTTGRVSDSHGVLPEAKFYGRTILIPSLLKTELDGKGDDDGRGHYVEFKLSEKGGCVRYFGPTAGSFYGTKDEDAE
jgi:hypothetical protein